MARAKKDATFEKDLEQLEGIVEALEEGGLSLDDALKQFEEGIKLSRRCEKALTEAEKKIELLTKNVDGDLEAEPFGEDDEASEAPAAKKAPAAKSSTPAPKASAPSFEDEGPPPEPEEGEDGELLF